jgi:hypothetical protein
MTLVKKKGKSPHREKKKVRRGSRQIDILVGIYEKGATFICPVTGEDPAVYFKKYKKIWIPQRIHYPISHLELRNMGVKNPHAIQYVMFASPNGHAMLDNYSKGIVSMTKKETQICHECKINSWEMFEKHKKVLRMENHHVDKFGTVPLCPTCHAATEDFCVNDGTVPFPAEKFFELLNMGILTLDTLHVQLKKYSPKISKELIKYKFYGMGLQRFYDNKYIPIPPQLRKYFQNPNAKKYFNFD